VNRYRREKRTYGRGTSEQEVSGLIGLAVGRGGDTRGIGWRGCQRIGHAPRRG
jgi:hypothetical protein